MCDMKARGIALGLGLLGLVACGASPAPSSPRRPDLTLEVTFGRGEKPKFDPNSTDPRVHKAYAQLTELVGHAVNFHFDESIIPKWLGDFDTLFAECVETVVGDLAALKR